VRVRVEAFDLPPYDEVLMVRYVVEGERKRSGVFFVDEVCFGPFRVCPTASPVDLEADVIEVVDDDGRLCCYIWPPRARDVEE